MGPKERIIGKALVLFYIQGIKNTGINQIIRESDVAKASFYNHFSSKDDLIIECTKTYSRILTDKLKLFHQKSETLRDFFKEWIAWTKKSAEKKGAYNGCPLANISFAVEIQDEKFKDPFSQVMDQLYSLLSQIITGAVDKGEISPGTDSLKAAKRVLHIYEGALTMWKMTGDISYIEDLDDMLTAVIF